jgi:hypothetical protein
VVLLIKLSDAPVGYISRGVGRSRLRKTKKLVHRVPTARPHCQLTASAATDSRNAVSMPVEVMPCWRPLCKTSFRPRRVHPLEATLAKLEAWLAENAPPLRNLLNPPATVADIAAFEARTSLVVPPELRRLYSVHDGGPTARTA